MNKDIARDCLMLVAPTFMVEGGPLSSGGGAHKAVHRVLPLPKHSGRLRLEGPNIHGRPQTLDRQSSAGVEVTWRFAVGVLIRPQA